MSDVTTPAERFTVKRVQIRGYAKYVGFAFAVAWISLVTSGRLALWVSIPIWGQLGLMAVLRRWKLRADAVSSDGNALVLHRNGGVRRYQLPANREGWLESPGAQTAACVKIRVGLVLTCWFNDVSSAARLLTAAGVRADRRRVEWRLAHPRQPWWRIAVWIGLGVAGSMGFLFWVLRTSTESRMALDLLPPLAFTVAWALLRRSCVQVGVDGLILRSPVRQRFISYRDITDVSRDESGEHVILSLTGGKRITLAPGFLFERDQLSRSSLRAAQFYELVQSRIHAASDAADVDLQSSLEQRNQPLEQWRKRLVQLAQGGYRERGAQRDEIAAVLDDAAATAEQRLGAALTLAQLHDPESRARVRVAADRCAEPKLRVALECIASGEIDDLEPLIDELAITSTAPLLEHSVDAHTSKESRHRG